MSFGVNVNFKVSIEFRTRHYSKLKFLPLFELLELLSFILCKRNMSGRVFLEVQSLAFGFCISWFTIYLSRCVGQCQPPTPTGSDNGFNNIPLCCTLNMAAITSNANHQCRKAACIVNITKYFPCHKMAATSA